MSIDQRDTCKCGGWIMTMKDGPFEVDGVVHTKVACGPGGKFGVKYDAGKEPWDLLPWEAVRDIVKVLDHGAKKYSPNNWRSVPQPFSRYFAAAMRHLTARLRGEVNDPESGLPHLAHAGCCILFLAWFDRNDRETLRT